MRRWNSSAFRIGAGSLLTTRIALLLLSALALVAPLGVARAQSRDDVRLAEQTSTRARDAFLAQRYSEAATLFRAAYEITRQAPLLFNIGVCEERQGHPTEAIESFGRYLTAVPGAEDRVVVEQRIAQLRVAQERIAPLRVATPTTAPGLSGTDPPSVPVDGPTLVQHTRTLERRPQALTSATIGAMLLGSGAATTVAGAVLLGIGQVANARVADAPTGTAWSDYRADWERGPGFSSAGSTLFVLGLAVSAVSMPLLFTRGTTSSPRVSVAVAPAGVLFQGAF